MGRFWWHNQIGKELKSEKEERGWKGEKRGLKLKSVEKGVVRDVEEGKRQEDLWSLVE